MVFSTLVFIFKFLPFVLVPVFLIRNLKVKNALLLLASLIFYAWGERDRVLLMIGSIVFNYCHPSKKMGLPIILRKIQ